jgi:hypothetical protein
MTLARLAATGLLCLSAATQPNAAQEDWLQFPFGQRMNRATVVEVTHAAPPDLLATIEKHGVEIRRIRSMSTTRPANPLLETVDSASMDLIKQSGFQDSFEGRVHCAPADAQAPSKIIILIRDTAETYTLIHEFLQSILETNGSCRVPADAELQFATRLRRLNLYQRHLNDDPFKLLQPLWRRDILAAQADVVERLFAQIQLGQSQEAIIEKVLSQYIGQSSPYFDADRRARGYRYGESMINNSIDLFNAVNDSLAFTKEYIVSFRKDILDGAIKTQAGEHLSDEEARADLLTLANISMQLDRVRSEIEVLKRFYVN